MGEYFDDIHAMRESQLEGEPCTVSDTPEISRLREQPESFDGLYALVNALRRQLRYREIPELCNKMASLSPKSPIPWRLRGGAYLCTLQHDKAIWDFLQALSLGGDRGDIYYRLGICRYLQGEFLKATVHFEDVFFMSGDEMGIAAIYWHTLSAARGGLPHILLPFYRDNMNVGHHTAYKLAVSLWAGRISPEELFSRLEHEHDALEYVITAYGLAVYLEVHGRHEEYKQLIISILTRGEFWSALSALAAYNDMCALKKNR